ncbi:MAG: group I intron-associated PD-(D/E)XK endonuclease, partial [Gemmataceae bacterium]
MGHHTKEKADLAVAMVIADAAKVGIKACIPITEHLPFDLVLVNADCELRRVQVRHAKSKNNRFRIRLRSCYSWKGGCRVWLLDRTK